MKSDLVDVSIFVESRYRLQRRRILEAVEAVLKEQGVVGPIEVSVAIVGDRKMRALHKKYKGEDKTTNILSFPLSEGNAVVTSDTHVLRLGDIAISYPQVIKEAAEEEKLVDDKIDELIRHGMMHLLGLHHE